MSPLPNGLRRISAGPIISENGTHMEGSLFIFEGDKEVAQNTQLPNAEYIIIVVTIARSSSSLCRQC